MLGHLEELNHAGEAGATCESCCDIGERHFKHLRDNDLTRRKRVPAPDSYMGPLPETNSARDFTAANAIAEGF